MAEFKWTYPTTLAQTQAHKAVLELDSVISITDQGTNPSTQGYFRTGQWYSNHTPTVQTQAHEAVLELGSGIPITDQQYKDKQTRLF